MGKTAMEHLWPQGARIDDDGELWLGGCAASALAARYGTPLYVFDESTLRAQARAYVNALARHYPAPAQAAYASKAYLCTAIAELFAEEGLDLDVVSGGELAVALRAGFPAERIHFHGNNKSADELAQALAAGVGRIVVDNFHELAQLSDLAGARSGAPVAVWLRLAPGVRAHTHAHIQTGQEDTKFGFSIASGDAERALVEAMQARGLELIGLHAHIGSQIYEPETLAEAAEKLIAFAAAMRDRHGFALRELSPGGGWGTPMTGGDPPAPVDPYVAALASAIRIACEQAGLDLPRLVLEPGRSLIARAGVALYTVGARKEVPGVRTYVAVDGGMADNIRPALYGAGYTARIVRPGGDVAQRPEEVVTIAGKFCESGDVLIRDIMLPTPQAGDLLAIPMAGAYTLAMASNYNLALRPAVLLVSDGAARLIQRRETVADLTARDRTLSGAASGWRAFAKYEALGNDYLVLDPASWPEPPTPGEVRRLCDRHRGIGADGALWGPIPAPDGAFGLRLFNPDGGEFEVSGNGVRIFARYLWDQRMPSGPDFAISTPAGRITAHVLDHAGDRIALEMGRLTFAGPPETLDAAGRELRVHAVSIGNPHCVVFLAEQPPDLLRAFDAGQEPTEALARALGPALEGHPRFPSRTNVQFARAADRHTLQIEIWERGAGYTLASGTSSCAAAGAAVRAGYCDGPVTVRMPGGELLVAFDDDGAVRLTGAVSFVCWGETAL
jgi:diaminopimelate decarboxylase